MIRLLCTYRIKAHITQQNYNCKGMGEAFLRYERERAKPACVRIEVMHVVEEWRRSDAETRQ